MPARRNTSAVDREAESLVSEAAQAEQPILDLSHLEKLKRLPDLSALLGKNIDRIDISGTSISDISGLAGLNISHLDFGETLVTDASSVMHIHGLETLFLYETRVSDLSFASSLNNLRDITINDTLIYDLSPLSSLRNIHTIAANDTFVSDISCISGITSLRRLYLGACPLSDISALRTLSLLENLNLGGTQVSDISALRYLLELKSLLLDHTRVKDISPIAHAVKLETLDIRATGILDIKPLARLTGLSDHAVSESERMDYRHTPLAFGGGRRSAPDIRHLESLREPDRTVLAINVARELSGIPLYWPNRYSGIRDLRPEFVESPSDDMPISELELPIRTFKKLVNTGASRVADITSRSASEWLKTPGFGPKSVQDIEFALNAFGFYLQEEIPEGDAWRTILASTPQTQIGTKFKLVDEHFEIDAVGTDSDIEAAHSSIVRSLHAEITRKASNFASIAPRIDNQIGWRGIGYAATQLEQILARDASQIPDVVGSLYSLTLELGSFLELDAQASTNVLGNVCPLEPEVRRPLTDLVSTLAPWLRRFPSVRQLDEEAGQFLVREALLGPSASAIQKASEADLISREDATFLAELIAAGTRGQYQGAKASNRGAGSARNLATLAASVVSAFALGAVSSQFAVHSVLANKAADFLLAAENDVIAIFGDAPADLRIAVEAMLRDIERRPTPPLPAPAALKPPPIVRRRV